MAPSSISISIPGGEACAAEPGGLVVEPPYGTLLAGGESTRYGRPKALATVGGERIVDRVVTALRAVTPDVIISANEPSLFADLELPVYPDQREGLGPLGGIHTTLLRAREAGRPGILAVACDMPFPSVELLTLLRREAFGAGPASAPVETPRPAIVLPASPGPRGIEPLFAAYSVACIDAIEAAVAEGDRRMIGFHERVPVHTIPLDEVEAVCDPDRAFLNVNTPEDRARAESLAGEEAGDRSGLGRTRRESSEGEQ